MFDPNAVSVHEGLPIQVVYGSLLKAFADSENLALWQRDLEKPHSPEQTHYHAFVRSILEQAQRSDWRTVAWALEAKEDPQKHPYHLVKQALEPYHVRELIAQAQPMACATERMKTVQRWFAQRLNLSATPQSAFE